MDRTDGPILIAGGGLGGLTTALALARRGLPVRVLEGAPEFGAIGYGIQFGPNVFHVFDRLGLRDAVLEKADLPLRSTDARRAHRQGGDARADRRVAARALQISLHHHPPRRFVLTLSMPASAISAITLEPEAMVVRFDDRGDGVTVTTEDGRSFAGTALIGADGIRSRTRAQLFADGDPLPNGFMAFRTIVPMGDVTADVQRDIVVLWGGPGFHIVHYPLRHGTLFNIVAVFRRSAHSERA